MLSRALGRCQVLLAAVVLAAACACSARSAARGASTPISTAPPLAIPLTSATPLMGGGAVSEAIASTPVPAPPAAVLQPTAPESSATASVRQSSEVRGALEAVAARLEAERVRRGVAGISAAVIYDQSLIWSAGFGTANLETGAPATPKTLYRVGSITKLFTDTMLMQLRDAGKLQLDEPVQNYLPELEIFNRYGANKPTLRELASHTGGMPREAPLNYWRTREFPTEQALIASLRDAALIGPPGGVYQYSNLGVALEGIALARAAGEPYIQYVTEKILQPLRMTDSGFALTPSAKERLALGSSLTSTSASPPLERYPDFGALAPAAELYTSVEDIAPFISLQFRDGETDTGPVLGGASVREMHSAESRGGPGGFAIGWELGGVGGHATIGHPGVVYGFTTQITLVPDTKLGVAVFTNGRTDPAALCNQALAALLPAVRAAASR